MNANRSPFQDRVVEAARNVLRVYRMRSNDASLALAEWRSRTSLTNAIRRDDAVREKERLHDAVVVARAVVEAHADWLCEYGNSLPEGVSTEAFAEATNLRREAQDAT